MWLSTLATLLAENGPLLIPQETTGSHALDVPQGVILSSPQALAWWQPQTPGLVLGTTAVPIELPLPVAGGTCVRAAQPCQGMFVPTSTLTAIRRGESLHQMARALITAVADRALDREVRANARMLSRQRQDVLAREAAMSELTSLDSETSQQPRAADDPVLAACQLLGRERGFTIAAPPDWARTHATDPIRAIARAAGIRVRAVTLTDEWWQQGIEAMIAFRTEHGAPVVLLPRQAGGYELADPVSGTRVRVGPKEAADLRPGAYVFYTPLPGKSITIRHLLSFGLRGSVRDLRHMLGLSLVAGLLSLAIPVATGSILGTLVPRGNTRAAVAVAVLLALVVFASTSFLLPRSGALLRMQGRMLSRMQSGLWDRLLALPTGFFHQYSVADLTQRAAGVELIQQIIAQVASQSLFALVTLVFSAGLLFVYNAQVAAVVLVVTLVIVGAGTAVTWAQIQRLRGMYDARGETSSMLLQIVQGIDKVRAAAAESRALDQWSRRFARQARFLLSAQRLSAVRFALYGALPVTLTLTVFTMVGNSPDLMSTSAFMAFVAALGQISASTSQLDLSLGYILNIVPLFDRMRPILEEGVEVAAGASDPGELSGHVALNTVTFRYPGMSSPVLHDIDLAVRPGEFLAIVGPSGCGKSTMVRLLLGFERPEAGTVTYDSKDLESLDVRAIRAQIGVAMQNAAVTGSDILSVIRGDRPLSEDEAWEAAEQVGIADDIRKLPMGMRTMIGDNATTFSGGQRQRLVLAAAIARKPRIVVLDEATSALDSVTQAHVTESFGRLRITRIVIAHRLSTIKQADRLVVLDRGRIVQQGSYQELAETDGPFRTMVRRQSL